MLEAELLGEHALGQEMGQLLAAVRQVLRVLRVETLDLVGVGRVREGGLGGLVRLPRVRQLLEEAHVVRHDPVRVRAREVAVDDLAHRVRLLVEHIGREVEDDVEHARLRRERRRAVLRHRVRGDLRVPVGKRRWRRGEHMHARRGPF